MSLQLLLLSGALRATTTGPSSRIGLGITISRRSYGSRHGHGGRGGFDRRQRDMGTRIGRGDIEPKEISFKSSIDRSAAQEPPNADIIPEITPSIQAKWEKLNSKIKSAQQTAAEKDAARRTAEAAARDALKSAISAAATSTSGASTPTEKEAPPLPGKSAPAKRERPIVAPAPPRGPEVPEPEFRENRDYRDRTSREYERERDRGDRNRDWARGDRDNDRFGSRRESRRFNDDDYDYERRDSRMDRRGGNNRYPPSGARDLRDADETSGAGSNRKGGESLLEFIRGGKTVPMATKPSAAVDAAPVSAAIDSVQIKPKPAAVPVKKSPEEAINEARATVEKNPTQLSPKFDLCLLLLKKVTGQEPPNDVTPSADGRARLAKHWSEAADSLNEVVELIEKMLPDQQFRAKLATILTQRLTPLQRADLQARMTNTEHKLSRDPADIVATISLAHLLLLQSGVSESALERVKRARNLARAEAIFSEALRIELNERDTDKAASMYREVLELQPEHSAAQTNLAVHLYYREMPKVMESLEAKKKEALDKIAPSDITDQHLEEAEMPLAIKRSEYVTEVKDLLFKSVACNWNKRNFLCHYQLGYILEMEDNNPEAAKIEYSKALMINKEHVPSHLNLGSLLMSDDLLDMALPHYRAAVKYSHGNVQVLPLYALANCLSRKGLFDEAVFYSKKAIEATGGEDPQAFYHIANIFLNNKKITDAIANYKKCIELGQKDPEFDTAPAINNLIVTLRRAANMFISKGRSVIDFETAARFLAEAIELCNKNGDNPDLIAIQRTNLAYCHMKANQPDLAAKQISLAISEAGVPFLDNFREVKQSKLSSEVLQQLEKHIEAAQAVPEKTPERARAHYNIAFCLFHMGEAAAAMGHLEEAVIHDPNAKSDYVTEEAEEEKPKKLKKKSKKSRKSDDEMDEMDAIALAENDAFVFKENTEAPKSDTEAPTAETSTETAVPTEQPVAAEAQVPEKKAKVSTSKSVSRPSKKAKAVMKELFGDVPVVSMSDEDRQTLQALFPTLKKLEDPEIQDDGLDPAEFAEFERRVLAARAAGSPPDVKVTKTKISLKKSKKIISKKLKSKQTMKKKQKKTIATEKAE